MPVTRSRAGESESPNPRQRQVPRTAQTEAAAPQEAQSEASSAGTTTPAPESMSMQQLMLWIAQQQQMYQNQMQTQLQMQMQQANSRFEQLLSSQGERRKKDPPTYEGKFGEDLELWIFATEEYYANKRGIMEADTSDFVTMISSSLGKSVLNWYRAFSSDCDATGMPKTWQLFKTKLRKRFRPKDFEYNLRERLFQLKQHGTIHEYVSSFQDLMS
ncbi:hypothetical protein PF010_g8505 [Phytophthora fragariae]|uniref:Retrotransposon gag domain-containing protein n=1 Tax=Phytophthora fragariae TaxID=53985 RepID=A0A6G0LEU9_9STRA|nr:hypothetical protein PF010_g8505 [Phytophthora fragariae]